MEEKNQQDFEINTEGAEQYPAPTKRAAAGLVLKPWQLAVAAANGATLLEDVGYQPE